MAASFCPSVMRKMLLLPLSCASKRTLNAFWKSFGSRAAKSSLSVTEYLNKLGYAAYENHRDITRG